MATKTPTKSILKKPTPKKTSRPPDSDQDQAKAIQDQRNLTIALNHATRLEAQKNFQFRIVTSIERLLDLPSSTPPTSQDCQTFTNLIHPFQPSDFASLVEERRIAGFCGYTLCLNPPRAETLGPSAAWKLKGKGAGDFCGTACVRKALYVKAQLSEVPAWERVEGQQAQVVLLEEDRVGAGGDGDGAGVGGEGREKVANGRELAAERGEQVTSFRPQQIMMESIVEKARSNSAHAPAFPQQATKRPRVGAIEGYESRFSAKRAGGDDDDDDDEAAIGSTQVAEDASNANYENDEFDAEEEAAWRELQAGLKHLNTAHDR